MATVSSKDELSDSNRISVVVKSVLSSSKYQHVSPALVVEIARRELLAGRDTKEAIKNTKKKLHQIGGAYFSSAVNYEKAFAILREAVAEDGGQGENFRAACRRIMEQHASTRERLPILESFYTTTLADIPRPAVVLDVACGLNPLAWPWMPFGRDVVYRAYDIYGDLIDFLQAFMELAEINGHAEVRDVAHDPPTETADLALVLKTLPCLEQIDKAAPRRLLDSLRAQYLLISFPARSLGGRRKGMVENYESRFRQLLDGRDWNAQRFEFPTELAFLVETHYRPMIP
jgi:16S rRNA (guanine(1405)-N(7))-methyltransferase